MTLEELRAIRAKRQFDSERARVVLCVLEKLWPSKQSFCRQEGI